MSRFSIGRRRSAPRIAGFYTLSGESLVIEVRWRGGGFVWNAPLAIHVQRRGRTMRYPVVDGVRVVQLTLTLLTWVAIVLLWFKQKENPHV